MMVFICANNEREPLGDTAKTLEGVRFVYKQEGLCADSAQGAGESALISFARKRKIDCSLTGYHRDHCLANFGEQGAFLVAHPHGRPQQKS
jgi:hypothetical protein